MRIYKKSYVKNNNNKGEIHMNGTNVKVEVQGLDTSKLPKLSQKEQMEMLKKLRVVKNNTKMNLSMLI